MRAKIPFKRLATIILLLSVMPFAALCATTPYTERTRLMLTTEAQENEMGEKSYREFMAKAAPSRNRVYVGMVERVGRRLAAVAGKPDYKWEFAVVESNEVNAFCLPGGKIVFYTGIMPMFENEAELAVVMGHEIAHAVLRHGGERMSQAMAANVVGSILGALTEKDGKRELYMAAFGGITTVGLILPYSRKHEYEADETGTLFTAKAGYAPDAAVSFWQKMMKQGGARPPEFLSTHPADAKRVEYLRKIMPRMKQVYSAAAEKHGDGEALR